MVVLIKCGALMGKGKGKGKGKGLKPAEVIWRHPGVPYPRRREPVHGGLAAASLRQTLG